VRTRTACSYETVELVDPVALAVERHENAIQLREAGDFAAAEKSCKEAVNLFAEHEGEKSPDLANALVDYARILEVLDRLPEADDAIHRALAILGPWVDGAKGEDGVPLDPEILDEFVRLAIRARMVKAWIARGLGRLEEAEHGYREAIELTEAKLGRDDRMMVDALNGLGVVHKFQGRYDEAEPLYRRAFSILEIEGEVEGEDAATLFHNLGGLAHSRGDFAAGEPLARRSVELREALLGRQHPSTAADRAAWGALLEGLERFDEAEQAYTEALEVFEARLGMQSLEVAATLTSLGGVKHAKGDLTDAEAAYRRALAIREEVLGLTHSDIAMTLNNLAMLLSEKESSEALALATRAHGIFRATLGASHPHTLTAAENQAFLAGKSSGKKANRT
jgi:tetratricopeptide (TPR) repeat protein